MSQTYGVISDTHCHNWSMFGHTEEDMTNNRLRIILSEITRAAEEVHNRGGKYLFHAGDLFHVRGSVAPSVLNPTLDCFFDIINRLGVKPVIICGNHDAEFRNSYDAGSSIYAFRSIGCTIVNEVPQIVHVEPNHVVLCIPWIPDRKNFLQAIEDYVSEEVPDHCRFDVICHVAMDGIFGTIKSGEVISPDMVLNSIPEHKTDDLGFYLSGHLHNHKQLNAHFYSIGAIAHHNWGDIDSKAGFLMVSDTVEFIESNAPKFVEIRKGMSEEEVKNTVKGNYVRVTLETDKAKQIADTRKCFEELGARGVTVISNAPQKKIDGRMEVDTAEPLQVIIAKYVDEKYESTAEPIKAKIEELFSKVDKE